MARIHARHHGRHKGLAPALWLAAVVVALFGFSLLAIVLLLHRVMQLALEIAGETMAGQI